MFNLQILSARLSRKLETLLYHLPRSMNEAYGMLYYGIYYTQYSREIKSIENKGYLLLSSIECMLNKRDWWPTTEAVVRLIFDILHETERSHPLALLYGMRKALYKFTSYNSNRLPIPEWRPSIVDEDPLYKEDKKVIDACMKLMSRSDVLVGLKDPLSIKAYINLVVGVK
jgi:hypothetical protein